MSPGANLPYVMIDTEDIQEEVEYWSSAIVCYVLGANPHLTITEGYFWRIWEKFGIDKIIFIGKGVFIVRFATMESNLKAANEGFNFFDQKPLVVKLWDPDMFMNKIELKNVPI